MDQTLPKQSGGMPGEHVLQRISWLTLGLGLSGAIAAGLFHRADWAKGIACGAVLGWLNFRWLKRGVLAMLRSVGVPEPPLDSSGSVENKRNTGSSTPTYLAMLFRYGLLSLGGYVIFVYLQVPLVSLGLGLCALGAATIAASVWEVLKPAS